MIDRRRLTLTEPEDLLPGDLVRRIGGKGVGMVESVDGDHATIAWGRGRRDILPLTCLRRVDQRGSSFDRRQA